MLGSCTKETTKKPYQKKTQELIEIESTQSVTGSFTDNITFKIKIKYEYKVEKGKDNPYSEKVEKALDKMYQIGYNTSSENYRVFRHKIKPIGDALDRDGMSVTLLLITTNYRQ